MNDNKDKKCQNCELLGKLKTVRYNEIKSYF